MTVPQLRGPEFRTNLLPVASSSTYYLWRGWQRVYFELSNWHAKPHGVTTNNAAATNISSIKVILTYHPLQSFAKPSFLELKLAEARELLPSRSQKPRVLFLLLTEMWEVQLNLRHSRLTQRRCWRFSYFGLWRRVVGCPVADDFGGSYCLHDQVIELL